VACVYSQDCLNLPADKGFLAVRGVYGGSKGRSWADLDAHLLLASLTVALVTASSELVLQLSFGLARDRGQADVGGARSWWMAAIARTIRSTAAGGGRRRAYCTSELPVPTSRTVPTLSQPSERGWDTKYSREINAVPTSPPVSQPFSVHSWGKQWNVGNMYFPGKRLADPLGQRGWGVGRARYWLRKKKPCPNLSGGWDTPRWGWDTDRQETVRLPVRLVAVFALAAGPRMLLLPWPKPKAHDPR